MLHSLPYWESFINNVTALGEKVKNFVTIVNNPYALVLQSMARGEKVSKINYIFDFFLNSSDK